MRETSNDAFEALRRAHYNAVVEAVRCVHDDLTVLRVRPDEARPAFAAGQYALLGLGAWEPRIDAVPPRAAASESTSTRTALVRRAYSMSCPLVDDAGRLTTVDDVRIR